MSDNEKIPASEAVDKTNQKQPAGTPPTARKPLSRKAKHGLLSGILCVLVAAAVVLVNIIAVTLTDKYAALTADITDMKSFAISEQTKEIVQGITKKVSVQFLSDKNTYIAIDPYCQQTAYMAEEMEKVSDGMVSVSYIDIVRNPTFTDDYAADDLSTTDIIVSCGDNRRILKVSDLFTFANYSDSYQYIVSSQAEQALDNAIAAVSSETITKTVLITDYCSQDTSYFLKTLQSNGYEVRELSLLTDNIPAETEMVVVYAPTKDYSEEAVNKLRRFLDNNGQYGKNLLFLSESQDTEIPHLDKLLAEYGMYLEHGFAFEADTNYINSSSTNYFDGVMCQYFSDLYLDITDETQGVRPVIMGYARPITILDAVTAAPLLSYSDKSGVCPFDADESWDMNDHITGEMFVLAQGQQGVNDQLSNVVVSGSYRLFTKAYYGSAYHNQAYLSSLLASINHRTQPHFTVAEKIITSFDVNISRESAMHLGFVVYALIPIVILGIGFTMFLMRRNR